MLKNKKFIFSMVFALILVVNLAFPNVTFSDLIKKTIEVNYVGISLVVDDKKVDLGKDTNGNNIEPFVYNGTTYLPVAAVAKALDKKVKWDGDTKTIYVGGKEAGENVAKLNQDIKFMNKKMEAILSNGSHLDVNNEIAFKSGLFTSEFDESGVKTYDDIMGKKYKHMISINNGNIKFFLNPEPLKTHCYVDYPANGEYKKFKATIGWYSLARNYTGLGTVIYNIYADDKLVGTYELPESTPSKEISADITGALKVRIEMTQKDYSTAGNGRNSPIVNAALFDPIFIK